MECPRLPDYLHGRDKGTPVNDINIIQQITPETYFARRNGKGIYVTITEQPEFEANTQKSEFTSFVKQLKKSGVLIDSWWCGVLPGTRNVAGVYITTIPPASASIDSISESVEEYTLDRPSFDLACGDSDGVRNTISTKAKVKLGDVIRKHGDIIYRRATVGKQIVVAVSGPITKRQICAQATLEPSAPKIFRYTPSTNIILLMEPIPDNAMNVYEFLRHAKYYTHAIDSIVFSTIVMHLQLRIAHNSLNLRELYARQPHPYGEVIIPYFDTITERTERNTDYISIVQQMKKLSHEMRESGWARQHSLPVEEIDLLPDTLDNIYLRSGATSVSAVMLEFRQVRARLFTELRGVKSI